MRAWQMPANSQASVLHITTAWDGRTVYFADVDGTPRFNLDGSAIDRELARKIMLKNQREYEQHMLHISGGTSKMRNPDGPSEDLDEDTIEIRLQDGYCYHGWIIYKHQKIPPWMLTRQNLQTVEHRNNNFLAFILKGELHGHANMNFNQYVHRKRATERISARIRMGKDWYYKASSFERYPVETKYHDAHLGFGTKYYPNTDSIYISVPEGRKNVVYKSQIKASREQLKQFH
ncbi:uncharacterized protein LOC117181043 [Belonocnema kinseyi]|uniref:uncharacterized protein LOC117181043 n=1 Tax=Belonocnema kinseyi TaxID=2817044 RepID=UPI00143D63A3|nr:uncharacterized protein LOC117181043 [Belonocnema kinseyi]